MPKEKIIYLLSASDRFNYGDLLFPIVAKDALSKIGSFNFVNVATITSNLKECGALETTSYKTLFDYGAIPNGSTVLVAGGQVLNANWSRLISFTKDTYERFYLKYNGPRLERLCKKRYGNGLVPYPFIPSDPKLINKVKIVYHAVGGTGTNNLPEKEHVRRGINNASFISAREKQTYDLLNRHFKVNVKLTPDSVIILSDLIPKGSLSPPIKEDYACVQFGFAKSANNMPTIVSQLKKVYRITGLKIGLISIGNCPGHDDQKSIDYIISHADFPITVINYETVDKITAAIAHAKIFIGTSLHGAIVSQSYGNPYVPVNKKIRKLDIYTKTWAPGYLKGAVDYVEISAETKRRLDNHIDYESILKEQKKMVWDSFKHIADIASS